MTESISVIIPTYNRAYCLSRAIDSVLAQSHPVEKICVIDDGSTDDTQQLLQSNYPQIHYIRQENKGVSAARNKGIRKIKSQWIAFLDSDDEWLPQKIEKQLFELTRQPMYKLIHCDEVWIRNGVRVNAMNKHKKSGGDIFESCLPLCVISPSASIIQRELLLEVGLFNESLPACEDYDLWLRICSSHPVLYVNEKLLRKYGGHEDQLSRQHWGMDRFRVDALDRIIREGVLQSDQAKAAREILINKCRILINGADKRGNQALVDKYQALLSMYRV
ncbi:glycosyltransferase [Gammaproteobacteria bacterium]|uniref:Glycosyl transferase n=1 Tax=OM182 bacterium MED-G28 TaxID=1986256 RepID=A0A2A5WD07_9GAMM|nr:glycosyltransferase [Gammaproteobacteria bacterium]PDH34203.1 MAG: glycosyl transferase [OM182 bacterium MED-G28]|tara:strand:+ start:134 stop:961 length:828 start_codon:yes stop_codon:yes gene_type:complete